MYWRQIAVAVLLGLSASYILWAEGYALSVSAAVAVLVYFAVRWFIAWAFRVRYWYRRGTRRIYTKSCPDCGQYIYRKSGDWVLKCHRCGWTAGLPIIRWLTNSVPSIQLRRTVGGPQLLVVVLAVGVIVAGGIPASYLAYDGQLNAEDGDNDGNPAGASNPETPNQDVDTEDKPENDGTVVGTPDGEGENNDRQEEGTAPNEINENRIEQLVGQLINEERSERGLNSLTWNDREYTPAKQHAENMKENEYVGHTKPSGETMQERYSAICGENANSVFLGNYITWNTNQEVYIDSDRDVAEVLMIEWMNSDGHRQNILDRRHESMAVAVSYDENSRAVYAVQVLCHVR